MNYKTKHRIIVLSREQIIDIIIIKRTSVKKHRCRLLKYFLILKNLIVHIVLNTKHSFVVCSCENKAKQIIHEWLVVCIIFVLLKCTEKKK